MPLSTFLNDRPFTTLRGLQWIAFNDTIIIERRTATSDSGGGASYVWNAAGTTVGRIYPVSLRGKGALVGGQINERSTHFCSMPPETAVTTSDRLVVSGGGTFEVTLALDSTDAFTTRIEVIQI